MSAFHLRMAVPQDIPALNQMIELSAWGLQRDDYTEEQIRAALRIVYGVDSQLVADGTFYAVAPLQNPDLLVACGGWSRRRTLFGNDHWPSRHDAPLDPARDAARIRGFFVHPEWARKGIGSLILDECESAAREAGFTRLEMAATLTGVPLYLKRGYIETARDKAPLGNGLVLPIVHMRKTF